MRAIPLIPYESMRGKEFCSVLRILTLKTGNHQNSTDLKFKIHSLKQKTVLIEFKK